MPALVLGAAFLLAGCPDPALTENPFNTPEDGPVVVSVCYPPGVTDLETETMPIAVVACGDKGAPVERPLQWKRGFFLNECPLFKAMRVAYICLPDPAAPAAPEPDSAAPEPEPTPAPLTENQDG